MTDFTQDASPAAKLEAALTDCASEPIRVPGAIQPHGVMLVLSGQPLCIDQVSANCARELGLDSSELLGQPLSALIPMEQSLLIAQACTGPHRLESDPIRLTIGGTCYSASLHRNDDALIIELEHFVDIPQDQSRLITRVMRNLQAATTLETLFDISVHEIQALTGYDRVMIYRFEPEGHGIVVAQALTGTLPSYSGLNFPASDIPAQARELYRLNWIRVIPDATYTPVPLVPLLSPITGQALDLGFSSLRSVSPVHCEYLKNMGVRSSMSISLLDNGQLWGLIACGHPEKLLVSREIRDACALIGQLLSARIVAIVASQIQREREDKLSLLGELAVAMSRADHDILDGLASKPERLQSLTLAQGAAVLIEDRIHLFGLCPPQEQVSALYLWIRDVGMSDQKSQHQRVGLQGLGIYHTNSIQREYPASADFRDVASGVIAFILPKPVVNAVMWFRPQLTSTMNWSGNPAQHLSPAPIGSASHRLHPRQSFDLWQEQVTGIAKPWSRGDLYAAEDMRRSALENDLERQVHREQEAVRLRDELVAVVSHDLRNPMSIIIMQCGMMQKWASSDATVENRHIQRALGTIEKATTRMNSLLEDLLDTAKIDGGRYQLSCHPLSVPRFLEEVCSLLVTLTTEKNIEFNCSAALGLMVDADPERVFQVISNLVGNAIKFTPVGGQINIGAIADGPDVLIHVSDTGIGIAPDYLPHIFKRYWSIKEGNPGGSGLGLYIAQGIVAAHGGDLRATSEPGNGSVFTFSLPGYAGPNISGETTFLKQSGTVQRLAQSISTKLERQQLEDRAARTALLNELNHRVKNTLSTVQAMASLTAKTAQSLDAFRKSFEARIFALSQAHDALARAEWVSAELIELIELIRKPDGGAANVTFKGDSVALDPRISLPLTMVFHELMANALQHGALREPHGHVTITSALNLAETPHTLRIDWLETGNAAVDIDDEKGVGFRMIRRSIERELNGTAEVRFSGSGLLCSMLIPWDEPTLTLL